MQCNIISFGTSKKGSKNDEKANFPGPASYDQTS